jgi:hypothetical protein
MAFAQIRSGLDAAFFVGFSTQSLKKLWPAHFFCNFGQYQKPNP